MSSSSTISENEYEIAPTFEQNDDENAILKLNHLPITTRISYMRRYEKFVEWKKMKGAKSFSESVLLAYFQELAKTMKPSTLWSTYSMLKSTIKCKKNIQIETYTKLLAYIKRLAIGHKSNKSKVLTAENVETFLKEAPDSRYLDMKVALIFGLNGACSTAELLNIRIEDIQKHSDQLLLVNMCDMKRKTDRSFVVREEYKKIVEKYIALRPPDMPSNRFFINYQKGKCHKQVIGRNKICGIPKQIAIYLKLPNPEMYTGHCFRRTSTILLGNTGVDLTILKQNSRLSNTVPEANVKNFLVNMEKESSHIDKVPVFLSGSVQSLTKHPSTLNTCEVSICEENELQEQDSQNTTTISFREIIESSDEGEDSRRTKAKPKTKNNSDFDDEEAEDKEQKNVSKLNDEYQVFGDFVASELRSMHYPKNRRALKRAIQRQVVHWTELDDNEHLQTWQVPRRDKSSYTKEVEVEFLHKTQNRCQSGDETDNSVDPLTEWRIIKEEM